MSEPLLTIDVDTEALLRAIDAMPDAVLAFLKPAAKTTADNIADEAQWPRGKAHRRDSRGDHGRRGA